MKVYELLSPEELAARWHKRLTLELPKNRIPLILEFFASGCGAAGESEGSSKKGLAGLDGGGDTQQARGGNDERDIHLRG